MHIEEAGGVQGRGGEVTACWGFLAVSGGDAQLEVGAGVGRLLLEVEGCLVVEGGGVFVQVEFVVVVEELVADGAWLLLDG